MDQTIHTDTPTLKGGERDTRKLFPLWRIRGVLKLNTPTAIGSGRDEPAAGANTASDEDPTQHVIAVMRDKAGRPLIPGSSLKGALAAFALRTNLDPQRHQRLFGLKSDNDTTPGLIEYCYLYARTLPEHSELPNWNLKDHPHTANLPHIAIDRDCGVTEDKLLFLEQVVPPGAEFHFECTGRDIEQADVEALLGLLTLASEPGSHVRLGGGKAADNGQFQWTPGETRRIDSLAPLWAVINKDPDADVNLWSDTFSKKISNLKASDISIKHDHAWLSIDEIQLKFHTPFIVHQRNAKKMGPNDPDGVPRTNHAGRVILPSKGLHGRLRSQAERILRTLGVKVTRRPPTLRTLEDVAQADLASVLFGATGWRSLVRLPDFLAPTGALEINHHMLAIDRISGGGKESAKFQIRALDCPTLTGALHLDLPRLALLEAKSEGISGRLFGLLAHVLRDLDDGDIPLGYGASKGYGQLSSDVWPLFDKMLQLLQPAGVDGVKAALVAFKAALVSTPPASSLGCGQADEPGGPYIKAAAGDFHNPYVQRPFGTIRKHDERLPWVDHASLKIDTSHHSHARYASKAFHGRIVCKLTTTTPVFVGAGDAEGEQRQNQPKRKENFRLSGEIALPATSLRGMCSSLHESITASRMRILDEGRFSTRASPQDALSAVGRVLKIGGKFWLQMLALPVRRIQQNMIRIPAGFRPLLPDLLTAEAPLKSLIGNAHDPLANTYTTYSASNTAPWYMEDISGLTIDTRKMTIHLAANNPTLHIQNGYLLGKRRAPSSPIFDAASAKIAASKGVKLERGVLRRMDDPDRPFKEINRKHELFIPLSIQQQMIMNELRDTGMLAKSKEMTQQQLEEALGEKYRLLPIPDSVVNRFHRLADEMTRSQDNQDAIRDEDLRPFHPVGTTRQAAVPIIVHHGLKHSARALRLKHGDLVYFKPDTAGTKIDEIAFSSIWRKEIEHDISDWAGELAPRLLSANTAPAPLSPSELLFGSVESRTTEVNRVPTERPIEAFAAKVQFGFGRAVRAPQVLPAVTLKILAAPKLPSPALNFNYTGPNATQPATKRNFSTSPSYYSLNGTRVYLHALRDDQRKTANLDRNGTPTPTGKPPWQSHPPEGNQADYIRRHAQRSTVTPIGENETFYFPVNFSNLSQAELESLCACLVPHSTYEHKFGMGKPIGLGSVKIEFSGLYLIDRVKRYLTTDFDASGRYDSVWNPMNDEFPATLQPERQATGTTGCASPKKLANAQMEQLKSSDPAVFRAILLTGNPEGVTKPVHYPQLLGSDVEVDTYLWFVTNEKAACRQTLAPFDKGSDRLPTLNG